MHVIAMIFRSVHLIEILNDDDPLVNRNILSTNINPMTYAIFFPFDEPKRYPNMVENVNDRPNVRQRSISMLQQKVALTAASDNEYNSILHGGQYMGS